MRKLFDVLPADSARGRQHLSAQFRDHIDFLDLPASVLDHLDDRGPLSAETVDCLLNVASSVVLAVGSKNAAADCELRVRAIGF